MTSLSVRPRRASAPWRLRLFAALLALAPVGHLIAETKPPAQATPPEVVLPDGGRYVGPLKDGLLHGQGRMQWDSGASYVGNFQRGLMEGRGRFVGSGYVYEGEFVKGAMEGKGKLTRDDGSIYEGEFVRDRMEGVGKLRFEGGDTYEGHFKKDKPTGQGRLIEHSGMIVEGRFDNNFQPIGETTLITPGGDRYVGGLQGRTPQGRGTLTTADKNVLSGEFSYGEVVKDGRLQRADGSVYEGEFRDNRAHGEGVLRYANGEVYRGRFAQGVPDGKGRLEKPASAQSGPTGRVQEGFWRAGEYIGPEGDGTLDETPELAARNNEAVLYNQAELLQQQLATLQPSDGKAPQMYALFVAGDGRQEVFRREVAFVDDLFARRFGTRGRAVSLVNSRSSAARLPLATTHSVGVVLRALAQKMNRERDLLFVFLTSHGSKTPEFVLDMNQMHLPWLSPEKLRDMLKASGIRNKVIVVSACYSGGFIPALKGDRSWVITAARADRTSFGCADGNDFTYFGRALFKESLPTAPTLSAAVDQAFKTVRKWEGADRNEKAAASKASRKRSDAAAKEPVEHSEPQSMVASAFRAEVDAWFKSHPPAPAR